MVVGESTRVEDVAEVGGEGQLQIDRYTKCVVVVDFQLLSYRRLDVPEATHADSLRKDVVMVVCLEQRVGELGDADTVVLGRGVEQL